MHEIMVLGNPSKRRRKAKHKSKASRRSYARKNPRRRKSVHRFRARRNPIPLVGSVVPTVKAAGIGTAGALVNDIVMGYAKPYLPAMLQSDLAVTGLKLLSAIGVGMLGGKILKGEGRALAVGAATCAMHDAARNLLVAKMPSLPLGEYIEPAQIGEYVSDVYASNAMPVSEYVSDDGDGYDN